MADSELKTKMTHLVDLAQTELKNSDGEFYVLLVGKYEEDGYTRLIASNLPPKLMRSVMDIKPKPGEETERSVSAYNVETKKMVAIPGEAGEILANELLGAQGPPARSSINSFIDLSAPINKKDLN